MTSPQTRSRFLSLAMAAVSMVYGALLAAMAVLSLPGVAVVAIIGGCLVGIGWLIVPVAAGRLSGRGSTE